MVTLNEAKHIIEVFDGRDISAEWIHTLSKSDLHVRVYDNAFMMWYEDNDLGITVINSLSKGDAKFPISMLKQLRRVIESNDKVILASSVSTIALHLAKKYGLSYNSENQLYIKGL